MVPMSVRQAWENLQESQKTLICRSCAKRQPLVFSRWVDAAGLRKFRHDSLVNRKGGSAPRLDAALFRADEGQLAKDLLVAYFTELAPKINDEYLEMLEKAGKEDAETKLRIYAALAHSHQDSPYIKLYLATALWVEEFKEEDIHIVETLATELASAAGE